MICSLWNYLWQKRATAAAKISPTTVILRAAKVLFTTGRSLNFFKNITIIVIIIIDGRMTLKVAMVEPIVWAIL